MMFKDKVTVVTGAGGTLCSAIAIELAKDNNIILWDRDTLIEKISKG